MQEPLQEHVYELSQILACSEKTVQSMARMCPLLHRIDPEQVFSLMLSLKVYHHGQDYQTEASFLGEQCYQVSLKMPLLGKSF